MKIFSKLRQQKNRLVRVCFFIIILPTLISLLCYNNTMTINNFWCTLCEKELPISNFSLKKNSKTILASRCDKCRNSPMVLWDSLHPESVKKRGKKYIESGNARLGRLKKKYNLSKEEYEKLLLAQNNKCAICNSDTPKGRYSSFNVDHDHKTNKVRGLLCTNCNRGLGFFKDDIELLKKALYYISGKR
jgi:hypothetical protein